MGRWTLRRDSFAVNLGAEDVAASTAYVLVDLSDSTNFPHSNTAWINLLGLIFNSEGASDGIFDVWVGVLTENDTTDGSATWVHVFHLESQFNATDDTNRYADEIDFTLGGSNPDGLNLKIVSGALVYFAGNQTQANNVNWDSDANLASPVGTTTNPGVGDVVVYVEEVTDTGTLDFSVTAIYETH